MVCLLESRHYNHLAFFNPPSDCQEGATVALWLSGLLVKTSKCSCKSEIFLGNRFLCLKVEVMVDIFPYKQTYTFKLIEKYSDSVGRLLETSSRRHRKRGKWCVCAEKEVSAHNGAWLYVVWRGGAVISTAHTHKTLYWLNHRKVFYRNETRDG